MPYTPYYTNGYATGTTTPLSVAALNHGDTQYTEAANSLPPGLFSAFVQSGLAATKDGANANQLDVTSGTAYVLQSDGTLRQRTPGSSTQTTSTINATYYLALQPDGTWYWGVANTPASNSLAIAQVTTDSSGNIVTVTDKRTLTTKLLAGFAGSVVLPSAPVLAPGVQLVNVYCFLSMYVGDTSNNYGPYVTFPCLLTNVPSSITLVAVGAPTNIATLSAQNASTSGFWLGGRAASAGVIRGGWNYSTVGNTLLAVDAGAGTYTHHCDACGQVAAFPLALGTHLDVTPGVGGALVPGDYGLTHHCPCGRLHESFTTDLDPARAVGAPMSDPHDPATRVALIHALQDALALPRPH